jgi:hypothetical protein
MNLPELCSWFVDLKENKRKNILRFLKKNKSTITCLPDKDIINLHKLITEIERNMWQMYEATLIKQLISYDIDKSLAKFLFKYTEENSRYLTSGLLVNLIDESLLKKTVIYVIKEKLSRSSFFNFDFDDFQYDFQYIDKFNNYKLFEDTVSFIKIELMNIIDGTTCSLDLKNILVNKYKIHEEKAELIEENTLANLDELYND